MKISYIIDTLSTRFTVWFMYTINVLKKTQLVQISIFYCQFILTKLPVLNVQDI